MSHRKCMNEVKIKDDVEGEWVSHSTHAGRRPKWPYSELEIGKKFHIPSQAKTFSRDKKEYATYWKMKRSLGWNFHYSARMLDKDTGEWGFWIGRKAWPGEHVPGEHVSVAKRGDLPCSGSES